MHLISGCIPVSLSGKDFHVFGFSSISVLNRQRVTAHNHRYSIEGIDVPGVAIPGPRINRRTGVVPRWLIVSAVTFDTR